MNHWQPIRPDWPSPANIHALTTTRTGGVSAPPFEWLNLGARTRDAAESVAANRQRLIDHAGLPAAPRWLAQVHGRRVLPAPEVVADVSEADAQWSDAADTVLAVLSADCLPVVLCDRAGEQIAIAHAGWRGLAAGVLEATVAALSAPTTSLLAWLGPAIGAGRFEVGAEVRDTFLALNKTARDAFHPARAGHWYADLYTLAQQRLGAAGVHAVYGGGWCTASEPERFYSHRRDGVASGRMATLIWRR